jgi:hypothetical protein
VGTSYNPNQVIIANLGVNPIAVTVEIVWEDLSAQFDGDIDPQRPEDRALMTVGYIGTTEQPFNVPFGRDSDVHARARRESGGRDGFAIPRRASRSTTSRSPNPMPTPSRWPTVRGARSPWSSSWSGSPTGSLSSPTMTLESPRGRNDPWRPSSHLSRSKS